MNEGHPTTKVHPRAETWRAGWVSSSTGWVQRRGSWTPLAQSERTQGPGTSRGTQLALSFWLGHSAHQQVIKDKLGRSAQKECILAPLDLEPQSCLEFLMPESNF